MSNALQDELNRTGLRLTESENGLVLDDGELRMLVDFRDTLQRIKPGRLQRELLVRASKLKGLEGAPVALDATAGLGEDSLLLAASGFEVHLFERNPVIATLLADAVQRARGDDELSEIAKRMHVQEGDSVHALRSGDISPDLVYLDPMFPERKKSAAVKKKFQLLQRLEAPCDDAEEMLQAAIEAKPKKIVIKRPLKAVSLGGIDPDYSLRGKAIRYDCLAFSHD